MQGVKGDFLAEVVVDKIVEEEESKRVRQREGAWVRPLVRPLVRPSVLEDAKARLELLHLWHVIFQNLQSRW